MAFGPEQKILERGNSPWRPILMIRIRKYREKDLCQVASLVSETFRNFNFKDNPSDVSQGYAAYYDTSINLDDIRKRFEDTALFFVADKNSQIVGMLRAIENRIVNLFVHENFHKQGIGKRLIHRYERECKKKGYQRIVLRSQIYAAPFYQACGYKKTTGIRNKYGLIIQPMKKQLAVG